MDYPFRLFNNCPGGNGLETMRVVMRRFDPRTLGAKRAVLKAITTNHSSTRGEWMERNTESLGNDD